jgi:2,4-dienoyl-CoA reductase (NADPH2)
VAEAIIARGEADMVSLARDARRRGVRAKARLETAPAPISASPATRPASITISSASRRAVSSIRAPKPSFFRKSSPGNAAVAAGRRPVLRRGGGARPRGHAVREGRRARRTVQLAKRIPGKQELPSRSPTTPSGCGAGAKVLLNRAPLGELHAFDEVVIATGIEPRRPDIPGIDHPKARATPRSPRHARAGARSAILGMGGIG